MDTSKSIVSKTCELGSDGAVTEGEAWAESGVGDAYGGLDITQEELGEILAWLDSLASEDSVTEAFDAADESGQPERKATLLEGDVPTGCVAGMITGTDGKPIPGALAVLVGLDNESTHVVEADEAGVFLLKDIPAGEYLLQAYWDSCATVGATVIEVSKKAGTLAPNLTIRNTEIQ